MHMAIVVLSVLLTLLFGFTGTTKVFNTTTAARNNAAHLGISAGLSRMIGAAEIDWLATTVSTDMSSTWRHPSAESKPAALAVNWVPKGCRPTWSPRRCIWRPPLRTGNRPTWTDDTAGPGRPRPSRAFRLAGDRCWRIPTVWLRGQRGRRLAPPSGTLRDQGRPAADHSLRKLAVASDL